MDAGQFKLHLRARTGTRIEETARLCDLVEQSIREQIPPQEIDSIIDNIGLPYSSINLSYSNSAPIGPADADILVSLTKDHRPTADYVHDLRLKLPQGVSRRNLLVSAGRHRQPDSELRSSRSDRYPGCRLRPASQSRVRQQTAGADPADSRNRRSAHPATLRSALSACRRRSDQGTAGRLHAARRRQQPAGFAERQFPDYSDFWLNPKNGVSYSIATQTPQYRIDSLQDLENIPVTGTSGARSGILASWLRSAVAPDWPWSRTTTFSR